MDERRGARLLALVAVALLLFNYPAITLIESLPGPAGLPLTPVYLFVAWALVILLAAWIVERGRER
jgi:hypothetical protein